MHLHFGIYLIDIFLGLFGNLRIYLCLKTQMNIHEKTTFNHPTLN